MKKRVCVRCERLMPHYGRGLCRTCYRNHKLAYPKEQKPITVRECIECRRVRRIRARNMCGACYEDLRRKFVRWEKETRPPVTRKPRKSRAKSAPT